MTKKMLIDASHPEETRVVIVDSNRVEELDFESANKRQLRGNVYLARVTRVEPSLQAAFVEYGGNRHGFLAFSEIHPDYYQIPFEDRMALIEAEQEETQKEEEAEEEAEEKKPASSKRRSAKNSSAKKSKSVDEDDDDAEEEDEDGTSDEDGEADESDNDRDENVDPDEEDAADAADAEVADEQAKVASTRRKRMSRRRYKIQEVVKRGQILLIQAVKEERGNKGAALTTYLSLAGRYCVLMPNTPRGGGISRKIANGSDRKRLKTIMNDLEVPKGMGVIVRTAGAKRTKVEIKRDYDYLARLWEEIRETTLKSTAPALIHEEGNLVKRSIRDLYNKDIEEVLVQGDTAYKNAKAFIKMLMPSHAKFVKQYKEDIPLFLRYNVERQIEASLDSVVQLKSGGYLVIHPTEALVSVDVNSGRSTKERNVERTALRTNLEAAEEVARQMRLRDLAGLIVIDFIDMDENRNNRAVEKKMKDAISRDRARIQASRISQFGLMEISRQRRRRSLLEGSTAHCEHCSGVGRKRTIESSALAAIRAVEEYGVRGKARRIRLKTSPDVALYLFNEKRDLLQHVDAIADVFTEVVGDDTLIRPAFEIEIIEARSDKREDPLVEIEREFKRERAQEQKRPKRKPRDNSEDDEDTSEDTTENRSPKSREDGEEGDGKPRRKGRRGRRGGRGRKNRNESRDGSSDGENSQDNTQNDNTQKDDTSSDTKSSDDNNTDKPAKSRRGRNRKAAGRKSENQSDDQSDFETSADVKPKADDKPIKRSTARRKAPSRKDNSASEDKPASKKAPARKKSAAKADPAEQNKGEQGKEKQEDTPKRSTARRKAPARKSEGDEAKKPAPKRKSRAKAAQKESADEAAVSEKAVSDKPKRTAARRKAPAKKAAPAAAKKPAAKKAAPAAAKKPAAKKAPAKKTPAKKATAKKAPAKKAAPKKPAAKSDEDKTPAPKAETPKRAVRKAPERKPAAQSNDVQTPEPAPSSDKVSSDKVSSDKPKKKGLWNRLLKS